MDNFNLKKFLGEKSLLKENAPGYDSRKFGEALPTLESVKAAHEAKEEVKEEASLPKQELDKVLNTVKSLQRQISQGTIDSKRKDEYIGVLDMVINSFAGENDADEDATASIMMDAPDRYLNEADSDGYVELMDIDDHLEEIHYEWDKWREGPSTEPEDIDPAKRDVLRYIVNYLNRSLK